MCTLTAGGLCVRGRAGAQLLQPTQESQAFPFPVGATAMDPPFTPGPGSWSGLKLWLA